MYYCLDLNVKLMAFKKHKYGILNQLINITFVISNQLKLKI